MKINPRRKPVSQADLNKAVLAAINEAVEQAFAIFFTTLLDKHGAKQEDLEVLWQEINELSDAITDGYVSVDDLRTVLAEEYNIRYRRF